MGTATYFDFNIEGQGTVHFTPSGKPTETLCNGCTDAGAIKTFPYFTQPRAFSTNFTLAATSPTNDNSWKFAGWSGDTHIDGRTAATLTNIQLDAHAIITARFVQCGEPFPAITMDLAQDAVGCPPTGWTQVGDSGIAVQEEAGVRYLAETAYAGGAYIERRQESPDTDITFAYRFATNALDNQEIRVHSRLIDNVHRNTLRIMPNQMTLTKVSGTQSGNAAPVSADFSSAPGVWYNVFMRTIGTNMYLWVQKADEAATRAIFSESPLIVNSDTAHNVTSTTAFRVNILPLDYSNYNSLQIRDINVQAYSAQCSQRPGIQGTSMIRICQVAKKEICRPGFIGYGFMV